MTLKNVLYGKELRLLGVRNLDETENWYIIKGCFH